MLQIVIEQRSVDQVEAYIDRVKQRIFAKLREGRREAMEGLAGEAIYQATAAGIHKKTGQLFTDILGRDKGDDIRGRTELPKRNRRSVKFLRSRGQT